MHKSAAATCDVLASQMAHGHSSPWIILLYAFKAAEKQTFFKAKAHIIIFQTVILCKVE